MVAKHATRTQEPQDYMSKEPGKYRILAGNFSYDEIGIGLPAGDFDWWRIVDTWVRQFNNSGENGRLFRTKPEPMTLSCSEVFPR